MKLDNNEDSRKNSDIEVKPVLPINIWKGIDKEDRENAIVDKFSYFPRAYALAKFISTCKTPKTACVFAEWGRGKTTIIKTVEYILRRKKAFSDWDHVRILRYNPWAFKLESFEDVWFSIIEDLRTQLKDQKKKKRKTKHNTGNWDDKALESFIETSRKAQILRGIQFLGSATRIIPGFGAGGKAVEDIIKKITQKEPKPAHGFFSENRKALQKLFLSLPSKWRVLLVIDDIDRCEPDIQVEILRAIHVFARSKNLICLLAVDRNVVINSLAKRFGSEDYAIEYIHKIIQLAVTPPRIRFQEKDADYLKSILKNNLGVSVDESIPEKSSIEIDLQEASYDWIDSNWMKFIGKYLNYNPRAIEKFKSIFEFRWSIIKAELPESRILYKSMSAAQAIVEVRWANWNWIAYRLPEAESLFKELVKKHEYGSLQFKERSEELKEQFPKLEKFLKNEALCTFYHDYNQLNKI